MGPKVSSGAPVLPHWPLTSHSSKSRMRKQYSRERRDRKSSNSSMQSGSFESRLGGETVQIIEHWCLKCASRSKQKKLAPHLAPCPTTCRPPNSIPQNQLAVFQRRPGASSLLQKHHVFVQGQIKSPIESTRHKDDDIVPYVAPPTDAHWAAGSPTPGIHQASLEVCETRLTAGHFGFRRVPFGMHESIRNRTSKKHSKTTQQTPQGLKSAIQIDTLAGTQEVPWRHPGQVQHQWITMYLRQCSPVLRSQVVQPAGSWRQAEDRVKGTLKAIECPFWNKAIRSVTHLIGQPEGPSWF